MLQAFTSAVTCNHLELKELHWVYIWAPVDTPELSTSLPYGMYSFSRALADAFNLMPIHNGTIDKQDAPDTHDIWQTLWQQDLPLRVTADRRYLFRQALLVPFRSVLYALMAKYMITDKIQTTDSMACSRPAIWEDGDTLRARGLFCSKRSQMPSRDSASVSLSNPAAGSAPATTGNKKGLKKIQVWKLVTGSSKSAAKGTSQSKSVDRHEDDMPLAPPPPLSYLVDREGGAGARRHVSTPSLLSTMSPNQFSQFAPSPPTAPSSALPSPTSSRYPAMEEKSSGEAKQDMEPDHRISAFELNDAGSPDLEARGRTTHSSSKTLSSLGPTTPGTSPPSNRPQSVAMCRDKSLPPLPGESTVESLNPPARRRCTTCFRARALHRRVSFLLRRPSANQMLGQEPVLAGHESVTIPRGGEMRGVRESGERLVLESCPLPLPFVAPLFERMTTQIVVECLTTSEAALLFDAILTQLPDAVSDTPVTVTPSTDCLRKPDLYWSQTTPRLRAAWVSYRTPVIPWHMQLFNEVQISSSLSLEVREDCRRLDPTHWGDRYPRVDPYHLTGSMSPTRYSSHPSYDHQTRADAPLFDRMTTQIIPNRFTASESARFIDAIIAQLPAASLDAHCRVPHALGFIQDTDKTMEGLGAEQARNATHGLARNTLHSSDATYLVLQELLYIWLVRAYSCKPSTRQGPMISINHRTVLEGGGDVNAERASEEESRFAD
ncbi:hypothetical protein NUW54_g3066 [Trametes sanguinea]|uniref:Uncharacterized protein n=1 Tax=Trametes sanguinea TaxID=158606 RepID=A0ACC1Q2E0_9APHY|nr:hypothetical protein NUW54_g3066 [Trametes sanguinea]